MIDAKKYGPWAVIAGASEGTGEWFARYVAASGINCILIARRQGPLDALASALRAEHGIECITASVDLYDADAFDRIREAVGGREVGLFISNAGADPNASHFLDKPVESWFNVINFNVTIGVKAAHHFATRMRDRGRGGILLVGSGACYSGGPGLATYSGSKAFLMKFCEGLWAELKGKGVDVLYLILKQTDTPAEHRYYEKLGLPMKGEFDKAEDVAKEGLSRLPYGPVHNITLADDDPGYAGLSAAATRERVLFVAQATQMLFGDLGKSS